MRMPRSHLAAVWGLLFRLGLRLRVRLRLFLACGEGRAACIAAILVASGTTARPWACPES